MRYPSMILALAGAALLTGCSSLISLNPFVADGQTATDPVLAGTWRSTDNSDKDLVVIQQDGSTYKIHYSDGKSTSLDFDGSLVRVGDAELMDIVSTGDTSFSIPVHMVVRIWPDAGTMKWAYLDSDWLRQQAKQSLATQPSGDRTLITTPGDPVVQFLNQYGADSRAYGKQNLFVRVP
jgi:hypothetical protein